MNSSFNLKEIKPKIFLLTFKNQYDLAMYFLRYQEFYESPSSKFRGKSFELLDFMRWYSMKFGKGVFTYPYDWLGFNIPGNVISKVWNLGILDRNIYDYEMLLVYKKCQELVGDNFYLIGAQSNKEKNITLKHEIAHGFFYTVPEYKKEMTKLVMSLNDESRKAFQKNLKNLGYSSTVYVDEIQAYMSTGLPFADNQVTDKNLNNLIASRKSFVKLFNRYYKG